MSNREAHYEGSSILRNRLYVATLDAPLVSRSRNRTVKEQQVCLFGTKSDATVQCREHMRISFRALHRGRETDREFNVLHSQHTERKGQFAFLCEGRYDGYVE
jgi:hypothetical protein